MDKKKKRRKRKKNKAFINQSTLMVEYGLSKNLIDKYFPKPVLKPNQFNPDGQPYKVWTRE